MKKFLCLLCLSIYGVNNGEKNEVKNDLAPVRFDKNGMVLQRDLVKLNDWCVSRMAWFHFNLNSVQCLVATVSLKAQVGMLMKNHYVPDIVYPKSMQQIACELEQSYPSYFLGAGKEPMLADIAQMKESAKLALQAGKVWLLHPDIAKTPGKMKLQEYVKGWEKSMKYWQYEHVWLLPEAEQTTWRYCLNKHRYLLVFAISALVLCCFYYSHLTRLYLKYNVTNNLDDNLEDNIDE